MITAQVAHQRLREGNDRYVAGTSDHLANERLERREGLVGGQEPYAVILGCADSRVPAELIFDADLGDLFVIRVAGNIVTPPILGSVEYAASHLGTRLIVVLGHTHCGAVAATVSSVGSARPDSPNIAAIVDCIQPSIQPLFDADVALADDKLMQQAVRANIHASAEQLLSESAVLRDLAETDGLDIVRAEYSLETGVVEYF